MTTLKGAERRRGPRYASTGKLVLHLAGGQKVTGQVVDKGPCGAFIESTKVVRPGTIIVVEEVSSAEISVRPHLVSRVVRYVLTPKPGAGIEWVKAVAPDGIGQLVSLMKNVACLELDRALVDPFRTVLKDTAVSYDFSTGRVMVEKALAERQNERWVNLYGVRVKERAVSAMDTMGVKVVQSEAPKQRRAVINEEESLASREDAPVDPQSAARDLEDRMRLIAGKKQVNDPVTALYEGVRIQAKAIAVDGTMVFLDSVQQMPQERERLMVYYTIPTKHGPQTVAIVGEVARRFTNRATRHFEAAVKILTVNEGANKGIFWLFVKK